MSWQDIVLTGGQIVFILALIPAILHKQKPAFITSLANGVVLVAFSIVYVSLSLWFAAITTAMTSAMWFILTFQASSQTAKK